MPTYTATAPWLSCRDLQRSVTYFRDVLGFRGDWHWSWGDPPDHAGVSRDNVRILLVENSDRAAREAGSEYVIYVRHVIDAYEEHRASGATIVRELGERPWGTNDYQVETPDGHLLVFTEAPHDLSR